MIKKQKAAGLPVRSGAFCIVCQGMAFGKEKSMADIFDLFKQIAKKDDTANEPISHLIVGLGNPGEKYRLTRHNAGYLTLDYCEQKCNVRIDRLRFQSLCTEAKIGNHRVLFLKPQTFMNLSGNAVREAANFYKIAPENVLVISDDISLPVGRMRLRKSGSAGGHNGLKSIIEQLGSDAFPRLRMGVGQKPHPDYDLADWVLSEFNKEEQKNLFSAFECAYRGIECILNKKFDDAIQLCNSHRPTQTPDQKDQ